MSLTIPYSGSRMLLARDDGGHDVAIKVSRYPGGARREWAGLCRAHAAGVPVPAPFAFGRGPGGAELVISQWLKGKSLYHAASPEAVTRLGRIIRSMHDTVAIEDAEWTSSGGRSCGYFGRQLERWRAHRKRLDPTGRAFAMLDDRMDAMRKHCGRISPVFCHNDLHDNQALFDEQGSLALIDFERWKVDSPLNDIAGYLYHSLRIRGAEARDAIAHFLRGYEENRRPRCQDQNVLDFYLLFISIREFDTHSGIHAGGSRHATLETYHRILEYLRA